MKKITLGLIMIAVLMIAVLIMPGIDTAKADDEEGNEAYEVLKDFLESCPNRKSFTEGEKAAAEYVKDKFEEYGYTAELLSSESGGDFGSICTSAMAVKESGGEKTVVITAHLDSLGLGEGAFDNGTGVAALLLTAKRLSEEELPFKVVFLATGGEEEGFVGADYFLKSSGGKYDIVLNINYDVCAGGEEVYIFSEDIPTPQLDYFAEAAKSVGADIKSVMYLPTSFYAGMYVNIGQANDGYVFRQAGIPSILFFSGKIKSEYGVYIETDEFLNNIMHTSSDTFEETNKRNPDFKKQLESIVKTVVNGLTNPEFEAKINSAVVVSGVEYELPYYLSVAVNAATIIVAVICLIKYSGKGKNIRPDKGKDDSEDVFGY